MSFLDRFRRRGAKAAPAVALPDLMAELEERLPLLEHRDVELELLRARLADHARDGSLQPLEPSRFVELSRGLDASASRRLSLTVFALDWPPLGAAVLELAGQHGVELVVRDGFIEFARAATLLELGLLRQSAARLEEFARGFLHALGILVLGETVQESAERLDRLDYARLLAEAERARLAAEERRLELERLQEEQRRDRGKW